MKEDREDTLRGDLDDLAAAFRQLGRAIDDTVLGRAARRVVEWMFRRLDGR